jgi:hypothetical protein
VFGINVAGLCVSFAEISVAIATGKSSSNGSVK